MAGVIVAWTASSLLLALLLYWGVGLGLYFVLRKTPDFPFLWAFGPMGVAVKSLLWLWRRSRVRRKEYLFRRKSEK